MEVNTEICRFCRRDIPDYSILTHEAHCERGQRMKHGLPLSPEPRSPSPVIEEPSEASVVTTPGDVEVITALDQDISWNDKYNSTVGLDADEDFIPDFSNQSTLKLTPKHNVTYIPIQLPDNSNSDNNWTPSRNIRSNKKSDEDPQRTLTNTPIPESPLEDVSSNDKTKRDSNNIFFPPSYSKPRTPSPKYDLSSPSYKTADLSDTGSNKSMSKPDYDFDFLSRPSTSYQSSQSRNGNATHTPSKDENTKGFWDTKFNSKPASTANKVNGYAFDPGTPNTTSDNASNSTLTFFHSPEADGVSTPKSSQAPQTNPGMNSKVSGDADVKNAKSDAFSKIWDPSSVLSTFEQEKEKLPGVTCPDCHRLQKAGGLRHHLEQECPLRNTCCKFCGIGFLARDLECHMVVCGTRSEKCPDCEEMVMIKYKHIHLESNHGFIKLDDEPENVTAWMPLPRLPLRPPDVLRNITLSTKDDEARVEIPCEFCDQKFPAFRLTVHQLGCRLKQQTSAKNSNKTTAAPKSQRASSLTPNETVTAAPMRSSYDYPRHLSPPVPPRKPKVVHIPILTHAKTEPVLNHLNGVGGNLPKNKIDVMNFGNVLGVSDRFKDNWRDLERRIRQNNDQHVIPCEYCSKMLRIGEVMSHQMMCFLQH